MPCEDVVLTWKYFSLVALIAALPARAAAQQAQPLAFEVASVRQAPNYPPPTPEEIRAGQSHLPRTRIEGDRVDITNMPMRIILGTAYGVAGIYVFGESWLESVHWDIQAKMPAGAAKEQAPALLRALLAPMGLKLERRKVPKEVVVIDHMNRTPTEN